MQTNQNTLDMFSGKTSPVRSTVTRARTSGKSLAGSSKATCLCLDLKSGVRVEWYDVAKEVSRGESSMLNISEYPNDVVESSLSAILEETAQEKYYLSAKACAGILRRAEKRGKALPMQLQEVLMLTVGMEDKTN